MRYDKAGGERRRGSQYKINARQNQNKIRSSNHIKNGNKGIGEEKGREETQRRNEEKIRGRANHIREEEEDEGEKISGEGRK